MNHSPRHTARGIVVHDGRLLLMERWRPGLHYFSIPGGGIEKGETATQAVKRELFEETSLTVRVDRQVLEMRDGDVRHLIFLCEYVRGEPYLSAEAPEASAGADNRFRPGWIDVEQLAEAPFLYWEPVRQPLIRALREGWPPEPWIVSAATSR